MPLCYDSATMTRLACLIRAMIVAGAATLLVAVPAYAANPIAPKPAPAGGLCAPWHVCVAEASIAVLGLYMLFTAGMYLFQRRGFDTVEHKQGHPEGVPVKRED